MAYLINILLAAYCLILFLWTAGALYYDAGNRGFWGCGFVLVWTLLCLALLIYVKPFWLASIVITGVVFCVLCWWLSLKPTHDRNWDPNFSQLPEFVVQGDIITVRNVRNTEYRSLQDYDLKYETREFRFSELKAVDVLILYWGSTLMSHPMAIFDFGGGRHLCISIEVRYRDGETYDVLSSLYRQDELMYVVSDERDAILRRTKFASGQDCYLYRFQIDKQATNEVLLEYIEQTNHIFRQPRWYNAVTANCTTSIYRQGRSRMAWDWRILFNGNLDGMMYERNHLDQQLPFEELKKTSWINARANSASKEAFSQTIRKGLPGFPAE